MVELYRKAGIETAVERALFKKTSSKRLRQGQLVGSFVLLSALGGDCIEDIERLRLEIQKLMVRIGALTKSCCDVKLWIYCICRCCL